MISCREDSGAFISSEKLSNLEIFAQHAYIIGARCAEVTVVPLVFSFRNFDTDTLDTCMVVTRQLTELLTAAHTGPWRVVE